METGNNRMGNFPQTPGRIRPGIIIMPVVVGIVLSGCSTWMGGSDNTPPLPGKRISVLMHESELAPDGDGNAMIRLPAPSPTPDWPQNGGYANHAMHHIQAAPRLARAWSRDIGTGASAESRFITAPIVADGRIYSIDTESTVSAFDARTGQPLWRREITPRHEDDGHIQGGLAYESGQVFAGTGFAEVIALDGANGKEIWRRKVSGPIRTAPTVRGGRVFVTSLDNKLHVLSAHDGSDLWEHSGSEETTVLLGSSSPAVDQGVVVVPYTSGEVVALKVENGRQLWSATLSSVRGAVTSASISHIRANPVIDRGRVFVVGNSGVMISIDLRTGTKIWERKIGGYQSPWVAGDYIFTLTANQELAALERETGRILWVSALPAYENTEEKLDPIIWNGPILVSDRLIVTGSDARAVAISPYSGRIIGSEKMPDSVSVQPIAAGDTVYFLADDATLVAYR